MMQFKTLAWTSDSGSFRHVLKYLKKKSILNANIMGMRTNLDGFKFFSKKSKIFAFPIIGVTET